MGLKGKLSVLFWFAIGVSVSIESLKLEIGGVSKPGPGFMSFYAGLFLIFLSLLLAALEIRKSRHGPSGHFSLSINRNLIITLLSLFCLAFFFTTLGYLISVALFVFVLFKSTAPKKWLGPFLWSLGVSVGTYLVFSILLRCNFPKGIFGLG
jgi:hypothetical protein